MESNLMKRAEKENVEVTRGNMLKSEQKKALPFVLNTVSYVKPSIESLRPPTTVQLSSNLSSGKIRSAYAQMSIIESCDIHDQNANSLPAYTTIQRRSPSDVISDKLEAHDDGLTTLATSSNAFLRIRDNLKRKRQGNVLQQPSFIHQHTGDASFNVFRDGFLIYPELCITLSTYMTVSTLLSLYAICKDFHSIVNQRFTTVVLNQASRKAHESSVAFPFRCYAHLCRPDPGRRFKHPNPRLSSRGLVRMVPSFRWLQFIIYRELVINEVMIILAEHGCPVPSRCSLAMKKMWFLFDIPDNARRIGFIHCRSLFTDIDLHFAMCFIVKLDMLCNDPIAEQKYDGVRKMLMNSFDGFTTIAKVLRRQTWAQPLDALRAYTTYGCQIQAMMHNQQAVATGIFGININQIGKLKKEFWGFRQATPDRPIALLLRPDQLIMREAIRRGYRYSKYFLKCLQYGYVKSGSLKENQQKHSSSCLPRVEADPFPSDNMICGVKALNIDNGGDILLDLGDTSLGDGHCVEQDSLRARDLETRNVQKQRILTYVDAWRSETKGQCGRAS